MINSANPSTYAIAMIKRIAVHLMHAIATSMNQNTVMRGEVRIVGRVRRTLVKVGSCQSVLNGSEIVAEAEWR